MRLVAAVFLLGLAAIASAQQPPAPADRAHIRFTVENPKAEPAAYSLEIYESGDGSYSASAVDGPESRTAGKAIRIQAPLLTQLFKTARAEHFFAVSCESPQSHVAFTGKKTLAYAGPDGTGSCTFNYSRVRPLNDSAEMLMDVAYTLTVGARLNNEHLHDRLSLDSELEALQDAAKEHRALELENIAPELESIAGDDAVMERARTRARGLLSEAGSGR
jgi:hypothetical protein